MKKRRLWVVETKFYSMPSQWLVKPWTACETREQARMMKWQHFTGSAHFRSRVVSYEPSR